MSLLSRGALLGAGLAVLVPAGARAAFIPSQPLAGPSTDLVQIGDVTQSRAGFGAGVVLMKDAGVTHVFVTRLENGVFQPPERIDGAYTTPASQPTISSADGGRLIVSWVTAGQVLVSVKPSEASGYGAPQVLGAGATPAADMSLNGAAYVTWTGAGGGGNDVRVAHLDRTASDGASLEVIPTPMDIDPNDNAGDGNNRPRVATSADGSAVVTWGELGHVYARRIYNQDDVSADPQDLTEGVVAGHNAAGPADLPDIDIEDDSSFAWVVFRQLMDDGHEHLIARRLVGSQFEDPIFVDGLGYPATTDVADAVIQENGEGEGMAVSGGPAGEFAAVLHDNLFNPGVNVGSSATPSLPAAGLGENGLGTIAWIAADGAVHARAYKYIEASRAVPAAGEEAILSDPQYGPVDPKLGFDLEVNRAGDAAALFGQTAADGTRLVAAYFDRPPGSFGGQTTTKPRKTKIPTLAWGAAFELWGPISYQVVLDGQPLGAPTTALKLQTPPLSDGRHNWNVVATDERGQQTATPARVVFVDSTPPKVTFRVSAKGRVVKVLATALDGAGGSGIARVRIDFGDGAVVTARAASHAFASKGRKTIRVSALDKAGNVVAVTRKVSVR